MREILFRGKSIYDRNRWIYGGIDFSREESDKWFIINWDETCKDDIGEACEVDPSTIGQYTGLTDKNGVKIFEGDIFQSPSAPKYKYPVEWEDGGFRIFIEPHLFSAENVEVVGNIYDNPELLKRSK